MHGVVVGTPEIWFKMHQEQEQEEEEEQGEEEEGNSYENMAHINIISR